MFFCLLGNSTVWGKALLSKESKAMAYGKEGLKLVFDKRKREPEKTTEEDAEKFDPLEFLLGDSKEELPDEPREDTM